jgi:hypothetical protein
MDDEKIARVAVEGFVSDYKPRYYHVKSDISDCTSDLIEMPMTPTMFRDLRFFYPDIGDTGWELLRKLNGIKGLHRVTLRPNCLTVKKNPLFSWDEIQNDILFALESVLEKPVELKLAE